MREIHKHRYGCLIQTEGQAFLNITAICAEKEGQWFMLASGREQVEIRITPGGRLRVGKPEPVQDMFVQTPEVQ